jgi:hypothetical protein
MQLHQCPDLTVLNASELSISIRPPGRCVWIYLSSKNQKYPFCYEFFVLLANFDCMTQGHPNNFCIVKDARSDFVFFSGKDAQSSEYA